MKYDERKAAQVAAFFLSRAGGQLEVLKLMKLMYLAERASFKEYGEPIIGDQLCSMEHGPVLSHTLNHMNHFVHSAEGGWSTWVSGREGYMLGLRGKVSDLQRDLSHLSDADLEVIAGVWSEFGHMTAFQLRDLTHKICTEWEDPEKSSIPIPYSRVLRCVGFDPDTVKELVDRIDAQSRVDELFARCG